MATSIPNRRRRPTSATNNINNPFEMSLSDLKKPMEDGTATTVDESCNQQSFGFLDKSLLVQPLTDTSDYTAMGASRVGGGTRMRDPSIKELQEVFTIQAPGFSRVAKARHSQLDHSKNNTNNNKACLNGKLQIDSQDSFCTLDSTTARAGEYGDMDESYQDEEVSSSILRLLPTIPRLDISSSNSNNNDDSMLDFDSVHFEQPKKPKDDFSRRSSGSSGSATNKKYSSAFGTLAQLGDHKTTEILGKKKQLLQDISENGGKVPSTRRKPSSSRRLLKDSSMAREESSRSQMSGSSGRKPTKDASRSRSRSPTARRIAGAPVSERRSSNPSSNTANATRRQRSSQKLKPSRDESPPPLLASPEDTKVRRTRDTGLPRRVKSSELTRNDAADATAAIRRPRRTKTFSEGEAPPSRSAAAAAPPRKPPTRTGAAVKPKPSFQEVAMTIDLDELTASTHTHDHYYYCNDDHDSNHSNSNDCDDPLDESRASLMEEVVQVVHAKEDAKKKRSNVMDNLLTMLLEDMGDTPKAVKEAKPRRATRKAGDASQSSGSTGASSGGSSGRRRRREGPSR